MRQDGLTNVWALPLRLQLSIEAERLASAVYIARNSGPWDPPHAVATCTWSEALRQCLRRADLGTTLIIGGSSRARKSKISSHLAFIESPSHFILSPHHMASLVPRATKRVRLTATPGWVCGECRRSFASSSIRQSQQQPPPPPQQQPASSQHIKQDDKTTHFGFETVSESLKASRGEHETVYHRKKSIG